MPESRFFFSSLRRSIFSSSAAFYLLELQQSGATSVLRFGYHVDGLPIRFSDGGFAAEVTLEGSEVTKLSLRFRQYTLSDESARLLPLKQALASKQFKSVYLDKLLSSHANKNRK